MSLSPAPAAFALDHFRVDWLGWARDGLFTEFVPQLYTPSSATFGQELREAMSAMPPNSTNLIAGVRVDGSGDPTAWTEVSRMLDLAAASDVGVAVWYADGILNLYPHEFQERWGTAAPSTV
uniref:Uncharacterized protein n=1 Tax=Haptolina ericina TaxID=156174 RepID=A0A7S3ALU9_9EUKA